MSTMPRPLVSRGTQRPQAERLGLAPHSKVKQWCCGTAVTPDSVAGWLERVVGWCVNRYRRGG